MIKKLKQAQIVLILFAVLGALLLVGCSEPPGKYYIKTGYEYQYHYQTDEYTIGDDYLILHGYWQGGSGSYYLEDYVLNLSGVIGIWEGNNQVYPITKTVERVGFWERVRNEGIPIHIAIPFWIPVVILTGCAVVWLCVVSVGFRGIFKGLLKANLAKPTALDPTKPPWIVQDITIPQSPQGIIATRDWKLARHNVLMSANQGLIWETANTEADEKPSMENDKGLYAYRLGTNMHRRWGRVSGIVSLSGHCIGHANGLVRAENCRILMLFCIWPNNAKELSARYGVPVLLTLDKRRSLEKWLVSSSGIKWLKQNNDLISGETSLDKEIGEILEKEGF